MRKLTAASPTETTAVTLVVKTEARGLVVSRLDDPTLRAAVSTDGDLAAAAVQIRPLVAGVDRVVIAADTSLSYASVIRVIDVVRQAGVTHFSIATEPGTAP